jgi:hypothetical protein
MRRILRPDRQGSPGAVRRLVVRSVGDEIPVADVLRQHVVYFTKLLVSRREEEPPTGLDSEAPQEALALDGDAGDTADADDV